MSNQIYNATIHKEIREQAWCLNANLVQSACNLTAVARSLAEMLSEMRQLGMDEKATRQHPAVVLFLNKMVDLIDCPMGPSDFVWKCFEECRRKGGEVEV